MIITYEFSPLPKQENQLLGMHVIPMARVLAKSDIYLANHLFNAKQTNACIFDFLT